MAAVKVVRFLDGERWLAETLRSRWTRALAGGSSAQGRPVRVALALPLALPAELPGSAPPLFAAVDIQWFPGLGEALANGAWLAAVDPDLAIDSCVVVAEEVVLRGREYLDARWREGGGRFKMMSFGRRHPALTAEEFSARWRDEAGRLGGERIPDEVRGQAYVQNHPVPLDGHEWPLDAVNEVYFDRLDHLHQRAAWFAARQQAALRSDAPPFMSPTATWSMLVRESVLTPG